MLYGEGVLLFVVDTISHVQDYFSMIDVKLIFCIASVSDVAGSVFGAPLFSVPLASFCCCFVKSSERAIQLNDNCRVSFMMCSVVKE